MPTNPVANWSKFVLPTIIAPAFLSSSTTLESLEGSYAKDGHAAVVGRPLTSMLSLTAIGTP